MGGRWEPAKTVERFFFHLKRKLSFKQYYLLWQWFSSWKTSWAHFHVKDHCITPEPGTGTKEGSNSTASTRHQDVLLLQPKPFGFSTTIFSIWFLAGIRKKKIVFIRSPSGKAPHPIPALPAGQASRNMALSLWIFISLGYWGRHLMRLLTETETTKFGGKAATTRKVFQPWEGSVFQYCWGVLVLAGTCPFQEGRNPRLQLCSASSSSVPLLSRFQLGVFSRQGHRIPSQTQHSSESGSSSSLGCHKTCLNSSCHSPDIFGGEMEMRDKPLF